MISDAAPAPMVAAALESRPMVAAAPSPGRWSLLPSSPGRWSLLPSRPGRWSLLPSSPGRLMPPGRPRDSRPSREPGATIQPRAAAPPRSVGLAGRALLEPTMMGPVISWYERPLEAACSRRRSRAGGRGAARARARRAAHRGGARGSHRRRLPRDDARRSRPAESRSPGQLDDRRAGIEQAQEPAAPAPRAGGRGLRDAFGDRSGAWVAAGAHGAFWPGWVIAFTLLPVVRDGWRLLGPGSDLEVVEARLQARHERRLARGRRRQWHRGPGGQWW